MPGQNAENIPEPLIEQFVSAPLPRASGFALVDDWDCLRVSTSQYSLANPLFYLPFRICNTYNVHVTD